MLDKPAYGSPCNSCGRCCQDELCALGARIFGFKEGPCPALTPNAGGYGCGLILTPWLYAPVATHVHGADAVGQAAALLCGANIGCDAQAEEEPVDDGLRARVIAATRDLPEATVTRARKMWSEDFSALQAAPGRKMLR